ncbi:MAG TPA: tryptophan 2,3-dioxygenase family protein [Planctomycetota bacterium]|jgi:tryptophan 2,3-dioxygenase|nr:tryptophan 2,3-dioxygenase family protein [Planctomycetota bacterium]
MGYFGAAGGADLSYASYLRIPELLSQQRCISDPPEHDEVQFIVVHQVFELWFKLILHELDAVSARLAGAGDEDVREATRLLGRVAAIEEVLQRSLHVLETMRPIDFLRFRDRLKPASGFQSAQFREVEFLAGVRDESLLLLFRGDATAEARLRRRLEEPSLGERFFEALRRRGFDAPAGEGARAARIAALRRIYEEPARWPLEYALAESLAEFDEQLTLWRQHHVAMVERVIGGKVGTGAAVTGAREGVRYLRTTLERKGIPELWEVRTSIGGGP